jgi:hypothetical protein
MRHTWWRAAALLALIAAGCSRQTEGDLAAKDPAVYARSIRHDVHQFVQSSKESPRTVRDQATVFLEKLESYPSHPVGENGQIYEDLTRKCKELIEAAKRGPTSADVARKLDEMKALADKLPD